MNLRALTPVCLRIAVAAGAALLPTSLLMAGGAPTFTVTLLRPSAGQDTATSTGGSGSTLVDSTGTVSAGGNTGSTLVDSVGTVSTTGTTSFTLSNSVATLPTGNSMVQPVDSVAGAPLSNANLGGGSTGTIPSLQPAGTTATPLGDVISLVVRKIANTPEGARASTLTLVKLGDDSALLASLKSDLAAGKQAGVRIDFLAPDGTTRTLAVDGITAVDWKARGGDDDDFDDRDACQRETVKFTFTSCAFVHQLSDPQSNMR